MMLSQEFGKAIRAVFDRIDAEQADVIEQAADKVVEAVCAGRNVHIFDSGHIVNSELVNRAGGLALLKSIKYTFTVDDPVRPVDQSGKNKSLEGLGELVLRQSNVMPGDVMFIGSVSGKSVNVIDLALAAKALGVYVIAITSVSYSSQLISLHSSGRKLYELGDLVLDNCAPPGDAMLEVPGLESKFGPASGLGAAYALWLVSAHIVEKLLARGKNPTVFQSINKENGPEHYQKMVKQYAETGI